MLGQREWETSCEVLRRFLGWVGVGIVCWVDIHKGCFRYLLQSLGTWHICPNNMQYSDSPCTYHLQPEEVAQRYYCMVVTALYPQWHRSGDAAVVKLIECHGQCHVAHLMLQILPLPWVGFGTESPGGSPDPQALGRHGKDQTIAVGKPRWQWRAKSSYSCRIGISSSYYLYYLLFVD